MLVTMKELLRGAEKQKYAVGAFNTPNLESVIAVISSAEELCVPVIIQHAQVHEGLISIDHIAPIMLDFAKKAKVPVCVHLDHGTSFDLCMQAIRHGFTSIMYDASAKSFDDNLRETAQIVKIAHAVNVSVEAELGHVFTSAVGGGEGRGSVGLENFNSTEDCYTNPDSAKTFVEESQVDALAISFGTTHGVYLTEPKLDLERITAIKNKIDIPFVMHGGSGVSTEDFKEAIRRGIRKINYYTYSALAGGAQVRNLVDSTPENQLFYHDIVTVGTGAIKENVKEAMKIFCNK